MKDSKKLPAPLYTRRSVLAFGVGTGVTLFTAGCGILLSKGKQLAHATATSVINHFAPPSYPNFSNPKDVIAQAQEISNKLEQYIKDWFDGKVPAAIPDDLLPDGRNPGVKNYFLQRAEEVVPENQWGIRESQPINMQSTLGQYPDPHATYLVIRWLYAPFGCKVLITGQFPHSRFFDIQMTPSFYPYAYRYNGFVGVGEVPIVDADIDPLPGSVNPFRVGADRNATMRNYQVTYDLEVGNPVDLNPAFRPPYYRAPGNNRVGGTIMYQGPWGEKQYSPPGNGLGLWDTGSLWLRYYAPDKSAGTLGGVPLPKVLYQLPDGRQFYINADFSQLLAQENKMEPLPSTRPQEPTAEYEKLTFGWSKMWGIFRKLLENPLIKNEQYVRDMDRGVAGRGEELLSPCNLEPSATTCTYINYLGRGMALGRGKIAVLTGTLPTTPKTRESEPVMTAAQARYWSLTSYMKYPNFTEKFTGGVVTSVMDDEIITDSQGRYILVYSRSEDRPQNATAAQGITWINWGPLGSITWTLRWMSIYPDWSFPQAPDEKNLGWATDVASVRYNPNLIGQNNQQGFLGAYQPVVHYLTTQQFEALGNSVTPDVIP
jgi:hypothetical protein